jgi:3'-phosphoadenosine 5'-phosphosulfate sulfotransferase (PAPS reductase)/FAD synthetase
MKGRPLIEVLAPTEDQSIQFVVSGGCVDPFQFSGNTCISFSGGRTSGLMLRRIIDAHGGTLPENVIVAFANTGKEREETLNFVRDCADRWKVPIVWLEFAGNKSFRVVDHATASRNGEPFETVIRERRYLPSPVQRFCTVELKIRTMHRYLRSLQWDEWTQVVGLRADEMHRVTRILARKETAAETVRCPLATAGITKEHVAAFWNAQPFDLALRPWEGNCDLCFLKGEKKRLRIISERPDLVNWWSEMEAERGSTFCKHRRPYSSLLNQVRSQVKLPVVLDYDPDLDDTMDCSCTD